MSATFVGNFLLIEDGHAQDCLSAAANEAWPDEFAACCGQRARTLDPPATLSPTFTRSSEPCGTQRSTREPKRTRPMRSPLLTDSCAFFHETTRRAVRPAICLDSRLPCVVARVKIFCLFCVEARASQAASNFPGR